jgi:hypothetical protein
MDDLSRVNHDALPWGSQKDCTQLGTRLQRISRVWALQKGSIPLKLTCVIWQPGDAQHLRPFLRGRPIRERVMLSSCVFPRLATPERTGESLVPLPLRRFSQKCGSEGDVTFRDFRRNQLKKVDPHWPMSVREGPGCTFEIGTANSPKNRDSKGQKSGHWGVAGFAALMVDPGAKSMKLVSETVL